MLPGWFIVCVVLDASFEMWHLHRFSKWSSRRQMNYCIIHWAIPVCLFSRFHSLFSQCWLNRVDVVRLAGHFVVRVGIIQLWWCTWRVFPFCCLLVVWLWHMTVCKNELGILYTRTSLHHMCRQYLWFYKHFETVGIPLKRVWGGMFTLHCRVGDNEWTPDFLLFIDLIPLLI